ncbi:MAG: hypothetical protein LBT41_04145 [Candidatus Methanoplasma sp.]|jgi:nitrogenase molybdenum-iron protein alpha/beta subunit|nr:hypothetical protein [Candidatus Methanoplasma sp.]
MVRMFFTLPPAATDFSGAVSLVASLGGAAVIHGPGGCIGNFIGYDDPGWYRLPKEVFTTLLNEKEAIMGDTDGTVEKIAGMCALRRPRFVAILGTPIPDLIGCDLDAMAREVECRSGISCIGISTNGYGNYQDGMWDAFGKILSSIPPDARDMVEGNVNVLGYSAMDFCDMRDGDAIRTMIDECGKTIQYFQTADGLDRFRRVRSAERNIVVSYSGLRAAEALERRYGTPYSVIVPAGISGKERLASALEGRSRPRVEGEDVLVIGDQVISDSVCRMLWDEFGLRGKVATMLNLDAEISAAGDVKLNDERDAERLFAETKASVIIGDPLFRSFSGDAQFIPLPHPGTSGRLSWNSYVRICGEELSELVAESLRK